MIRLFGIRFSRLLVSVCTALLIAAPMAHAVGGCGRVINLVKKSETTRGGRVIYKSNSSTSGKDLPYSAGNHSQAGPAILFDKSSGLFPSGSSITAMNLTGVKIASGFRRARCTPAFGCGDYERWYFGYNSAATLRRKAPNGMLIKARGTTCIKVKSIYNRREQY